MDVREVEPNAGPEPLGIAGARHERTLSPVGSSPSLGTDSEGVGLILIQV